MVDSPGDPAAVGATFDGSAVHFTFAIPQGAPGEITAAALTPSPSATPQSEVQRIVNAHNALLAALVRANKFP